VGLIGVMGSILTIRKDENGKPLYSPEQIEATKEPKAGEVEKLSPALQRCMNKYFPAGATEHAPLVELGALLAMMAYSRMMSLRASQ